MTDGPSLFTCCIYDVRIMDALASAPEKGPARADTDKNTVARRRHHRRRQAAARRRPRLRPRQGGVLDRRYEGGTLLTEGELAEAVGVSRTPVREALLRLEVEGLIKLYPKKGALVLPVSAQEIADVVETRLLVEEHAVAQGRTRRRRG